MMSIRTNTTESNGNDTPTEKKYLTSIVYAPFNYYSLDTQPLLDDVSIFNGTSTDITSCILPVIDLRSLSAPLSSYNHETHGFQILNQPLPIDNSHSSVHDPGIMNSQYYPSIVSLLKDKLKVRSAVVINHTLRDVPSMTKHHVDPKNPRPLGRSMAPFFLAHSDYSPAAARAHLRAMTSAWFEETNTNVGTTEKMRQEFFCLRDEIISAEDNAIQKAGLEPGNGDILTGKGGHWNWDGQGYKGPRYAMFSIWRPWETVRRDPLALMDTHDSDFSYTRLPRSYKYRPGCVEQYYNENALMKPPKPEVKIEHKWYYISNQRPDEVYAIKFYDSQALREGNTGIRLMCPHSAFHIDEMNHEPVRRSCELRVWCIW